MTMVRACIQQVPQQSPSPVPLEMDEVEATAESYLAAVDAVEAKVPPGWRILYVSKVENGSGTPEQPDG